MPTRCSCRWDRPRKTSKRRSTTCASTAARRSVRSTRTSSVRSPMRPSSRRWPGRRTSSSSSAPTSRWRATTRWGATSGRRCTRRCRARPGSRTSPLDQMPRLFGGVYGLGSRDFRPEHTIGAYEFAMGKRARKDGKARGGRRVVLRARHRSPLRGEVRRHAVAAARRGDRRPLPFRRRLGRDHDRQEPRRDHRRPERSAVRPRQGRRRIRQSEGDHPRQRESQVRFREEGRADLLLHGRRARADPGELRPAPRQRRAVLRPQGVHPLQPARRHVGGRLPRLGVRGGRRAGVGAAPAVGAPADHREEDPRLHAAGVRDCPEGHRPRRPAAAHAGQRVPRRVLLRVAAARGISHHPGTVPRGRAQAVREEVRPVGRGRRDVQHGGHDAGLRARAGDPHRRARGGRSIQHARKGAAAGRRREREWERRRPRLRVGMPLARDSRGPGRAHAAHADQGVRRPVPVGLRVRPAGQRLCVARHHGRGQRRHRVEVRGAPGDAALHRRELHAVHGVHRGLSRHGAAQLLAGSRDGAADRRHQLRDRCRRASEDVPFAAGDREAHARADARRGGQEREDAVPGSRPRRHQRRRRLLAGGEEPVLRRHRQGAAGLSEDERDLRDAGEEGSRRRRRLLDLRVGSVQRAARPA